MSKRGAGNFKEGENTLRREERKVLRLHEFKMAAGKNDVLFAFLFCQILPVLTGERHDAVYLSDTLHAGDYQSNLSSPVDVRSSLLDKTFSGQP